MNPTALPWDEVIDAANAAPQVLVVAHVNPDADALGSALALRAALSATGTTVQVGVGQPGFAIPRSLAWLPGAQHVRAPEELTDGESLVVAVDCAAADRLGTLLARARAADTFAVIDHHSSNDAFGQINLIEHDAPATGVLIAELIDRAGWPWVDGVAENLYAAISSDTGSFRFPATSAHTHRLAAQLHERGIDHAAIARHLFASRPLAVSRLSAQVLVDALYDPDGAGGAGVIIATVDSNTRGEHGVTYDDVESVVSDLAAIGEADTAVVVKQSDDGAWKVSLRSKGHIDVGRLASKFGGGGHRQAAGYTAGSTVGRDAADAGPVVAQLRQALSDPEFQLP